MANNETVLKIKAQIDGLQGLEKLKSSMKRISAEVDGAENNFSELLQKLKQLQASSVKSINNLNAQRDAFEQLRRSVDLNSKEFKEARDEIEKIDRALKQSQGTVGRFAANSIKSLRTQKEAFLAVRDSADLMSKEFKEAGVELAKLDKKLAKAEGKGGGRGRRLRAGAQIAGTVAGAGVFGGPEGAIGSLTGAAFGGLPGAVVGGAIGAQVSQLRKLATSTAEYKAEVSKLRIALQNVVGLDYQFSLNAIEEASTDFNFSIKDTTRTFTRLAAAGTANGNTVKELEVLYRGLAAATKATGGSTEDLNGVLLAATQVLSKGKVSAEELRGQIGERLPGAFSLFAQATGRTTQQLDEALKAGAVSAEEFVTDFANFINNKYKNAAAEIANSPAEAGARLELTLKNLQLAIGPILADIGAGFQQFAIDAINDLNPLIAKLNEFLRVDRKGKNARLYELEGGGVAGVGRIDLIRSEINRVLGIQAGKPIETERIPGAGQYVGTSKDDAFEFLSKALVRAESQAAQLRLELFPVARKQADLPTSRRAQEEEKTKTKTKRPARADFSMLEGAFARDAALRVLKENKAIEIEILKAEFEGNKAQVFALKQKQERLKVNQIIVSLEELTRQRAIQIVNAQSKGLDVARAQSKQLDDQNNLQLARIEKEALLTEQEVERLKFEKEITAELDKQRRSFEDQFLDRQRELGLISSGDYNQVLLGRERERLEDPRLGLTPEQQSRGLDQYRQIIDPTLVEGLTQNIAKLKEDLAELVNPINQVTSAATAIGTAFSDSFKSVIDGSATTQEALAGFFRNIASYFLDMAVQIIQKMITMYILNTVVGLLPGSGSAPSFGSGVGSLPLSGDYSGLSGTPFAKGGVFAKNKIVPYAKGGIVNKPTMFAYANGGTGRFGLMGEAGPEAILPLQRGPGGKLGVQASGGVGNVVVNVDASGTKAEGDGPKAKQLGSLIGSAVQAELVKQKRPGGLLTS